MKLEFRKLLPLFVVLLTVGILYCVYTNYVKTREGFQEQSKQLELKLDYNNFYLSSFDDLKFSPEENNNYEQIANLFKFIFEINDDNVKIFQYDINPDGSDPGNNYNKTSKIISEFTFKDNIVNITDPNFEESIEMNFKVENNKIILTKADDDMYKKSIYFMDIETNIIYSDDNNTEFDKLTTLLNEYNISNNSLILYAKIKLENDNYLSVAEAEEEKKTLTVLKHPDAEKQTSSTTSQESKETKIKLDPSFLDDYSAEEEKTTGEHVSYDEKTGILTLKRKITYDDEYSPEQITLKLSDNKDKLLVSTTEFKKRNDTENKEEEVILENKEEEVTLTDEEVNNLVIELNISDTEHYEGKNLSIHINNTIFLTIDTPEQTNIEILKKFHKEHILKNKATLGFSHPKKNSNGDFIDYSGNNIFTFIRTKNTDNDNVQKVILLEDDEPIIAKYNYNSSNCSEQLKQILNKLNNMNSGSSRNNKIIAKLEELKGFLDSKNNTTESENPNNSIQTNKAKEKILNKLNDMTEAQRMHVKKLLELIRPDDNINRQLITIKEQLFEIHNKKNKKEPNSQNPTLAMLNAQNPFISRIQVTLSGVQLKTIEGMIVIIDTLLGMKNKNMQNVVIQNTILQINFHKSKHEGLGMSLFKSLIKEGIKMNETSGFSTEGGEGVPTFDSNKMNNRSKTTTNELKKMLQNFRHQQPATQGITPTVVKERVVYPETSVYSGYGRPKMMTEIDPHTKRPDKPPACIPQEKMPNGPVPLLEYANASDYTGVGSILPAFVYDETYDKKHYTRSYNKQA